MHVDRPEAGHHTVTLAPGLQDRASEILKEGDRAVTYGHRAPYLHLSLLRPSCFPSNKGSLLQPGMEMLCTSYLELPEEDLQLKSLIQA